MSLSITVYCSHVATEFVPLLMKRLNDYDMEVVIHPDFKFDEKSDRGFVPFKFRFKNTTHASLKGKTLKSGFELYIDDFNLQVEKEGVQPKPKLFAKLLGKKQEEVPFAPPEIEARLEKCHKAVQFVWHAGDSFEFRFASMSSAVLTELTGGVRCYHADDIWYDNKNIVNNAFKELIEEEKSIPESEIEFHEFDEW